MCQVHNAPAGYKLTKSGVKAAADKGGPKLTFTSETCFLDAAVNGDSTGVNQALADGVDIQCADADGMTALHKACLENYLPIVSALVAKGADINCQDNDWWTPLHAAASGGNWRICNMLFSNGADPLAVNAEGDLPFDLVNDTKVEGIIKREMEGKGCNPDDEDAIEELRGKPEATMMDDVKTAIAEGTDLNQQGAFGATCLHIAASNGFVEVLTLLLETPKINPNVADENGDTALHVAVQQNQYDCVLKLWACGANPEAKNNLKQKPIIVSEDQTMIRLIQALEKKAGAAGTGDALKGQSRKKYTGSISRQSRAAKGDMSKKDMKGEAASGAN
jgi:protein phosphatase 1 regulatory subunit 16A